MEPAALRDLVNSFGIGFLPSNASKKDLLEHLRRFTL